MTPRPRVTMGLPVFNGERFLRDALDSALAQTYPHVRIIISDNGSTDGTEVICREYAARDSRIEYHREEENRGAAWNFRRVFELSSDPLFKWLAHDDAIAPDFLARCVAALNDQPDAVLAFPMASLIDASGCTFDEPGYELETGSSDAYVRFRDLVFSANQCFEIFGLIRSDALAKTQVMGGYPHADGVILAHLALMGPFARVDDRLFISRQHENQSVRVHGGGADVGRPDYQAYAAWFANRTSRFILPNWRIMGEYARTLVVTRAPSLSTRLRSATVVVRWAKRHRSFLVEDLRFAWRNRR